MAYSLHVMQCASERHPKGTQHKSIDMNKVSSVQITMNIVNIQGTQVRHVDVDDNYIDSTCECTRYCTYKVSRSNDCGR